MYHCSNFTQGQALYPTKLRSQEHWKLKQGHKSSISFICDRRIGGMLVGLVGLFTIFHNIGGGAEWIVIPNRDLQDDEQ